MCIQTLQKVQTRLRIEHVRKRPVEGEEHFVAKLEAKAVLRGQIDRGYAHDAVLADGGHVNIQLAAHHLGNIHLGGDGVLALGGEQFDVFGADAQHDLLGRNALCRQRALHLLREFDDRVLQPERQLAAGSGEFGVEEVHLRRADEARDEQIDRVIEHLLRRADLLDKAVAS